jgi:hypothetical protein
LISNPAPQNVSQTSSSEPTSEYCFISSLQLSWTLNLFLSPLVEECYGTRYQSGSFSLTNVGSGFSLPASFCCCAGLRLPTTWSPLEAAPLFVLQVMLRGSASSLG